MSPHALHAPAPARKHMVPALNPGARGDRVGVRGAGRGAAARAHMLMHSHDPNEAEAARVQMPPRCARWLTEGLRSGEVEHGCESPVQGSTCTCMYAHTACRVLACFVRGVIACNHWLESHPLGQWLGRPHVASVEDAAALRSLTTVVARRVRNLS